MTLPIPLSVRLVTARTDRHIERDLRSLSFRSVVPGGFASAQFSLDRPLAIQPDEIAYYAKVHIYDTRTGRVVWSGRLEDPGRGVGGDGQVWDLAALGPSAHAKDRTVPLHYVDTSLERWESADDPDEARFRVSNDSSSESIPALRYTLMRGTQLPIGLYKLLRYRTVDDAGLKLARISGEVKSGTAYVGVFTQILTRTGVAGAADVALSQAWGTSVTALEATTAGTITNGRTVVEIRIERITSTLTVGDDASTSVLRDPVVQAMRHTKAGVEITTGYTSDTLRGDSVVNDLLGRLLTDYDGANADVEETVYNIDQLVYKDAVTPAQVLDDLMTLEPGFYWAAWERNVTTDKHRFEWRQWPTTVRYEADVSDGYKSTGSAEGLYNRATVRYYDRNGRVRFYTHTGQPVAELDDAGLIRQAFLDTGRTFGSLANATQIAALFLQGHRFPPNRGSLTVARPIYDADRRTTVAPWEIRPGHLIRVRGILARPDSLNATEPDGVTVFKIVGVDYDTGSASATLELDSQPDTLSHLLARMQAVIDRQRNI